MTTITLRSEVGDDGKLRIEVPCALPPGPVEVVLVVQSTEPQPKMSTCSGLFLDLADSGANLDEILSEMNSEWVGKLADLKS